MKSKGQPDFHGRRLNGMLPVCLLFMSGVVSLSAETMWIRLYTRFAGCGTAAASLIISVFFLMAALGAYYMQRRVESLRRPLMVWGGLESLAAVLVMVSLFWVNWLSRIYPAGMAGPWNRLPFLFLHVLLGTGAVSLLQGMAFPLSARVWLQPGKDRSLGGGLIYAVQLAGAAAGTVAGGFFLPLYFGYEITSYWIGGAGLVAGLSALLIGIKAAPPPGCRTPDPGSSGPGNTRLAGLAAASGALVLTLEMAAYSLLRRSQHDSLSSSVTLLLVFLTGLAGGSLLTAVLRRRYSWDRLMTLALAAAVPLCVLAPVWSRLGLMGWAAGAAEPAGRLGRQILICGAIWFPVLLSCGAVFPLCWEKVRECGHGASAGRVSTWNKLGAAAGVWIAAFIILPGVGAEGACIVAAMGYASILLLMRSSWKVCSPSFLLAAVLVLFHPPAVHLSDGERLLAHAWGRGNSIEVIENQDSRFIRLDGTYQLNGTGAALPWEIQEAHIPLILSRKPDRVLFLGTASGISANAILDFPVRELVSVELDPVVQKMAGRYFAPWNQRLFNNPRARLVVDDGRMVLAGSPEPFDLVVGTLFHPARESTSFLYSTDFFKQVSQSMTTLGVFCLWLPAFQLDRELFDSVARSFASVFPSAILIRGNLSPAQPVLGLVGSQSHFDLSDGFLETRLRDARAAGAPLQGPFFRSAQNFRLIVMGDLHDIPAAEWSSPLNSDTRPWFSFHGDRPLGAGDPLHGMVLLQNLGTRFLQGRFDSIKGTGREQLIAGIRAGNYLYASYVYSVPVPAEAAQQIKRIQQAEQSRETALRLCPGLQLEPDDARY